MRCLVTKRSRLWPRVAVGPGLRIISVGSNRPGTVFGGTDLLFATYLAVTEASSVTHAFVCSRHDPGNGVVNGRLIADMSLAVLGRERREFERFCKRSREGRRVLARPNFMSPGSV